MQITDTVYIKFFAAVDGNSTNALMNVIDQQIAQKIKELDSGKCDYRKSPS
ncbi:MAG: hypothetical protein WDZ43_06120 [Nitrosopumilaceae archaeon]